MYYYFINTSNEWEAGVHFTPGYLRYNIGSVESEDMLFNKYLILEGFPGVFKEFELLGKNSYYYEATPY